MTAVRPSPRFNIIRKFSRSRLAQRPSSTVSVVVATDVTADVSEQSNKESVDAGFCGEPFADKGELLSSLSPLLFSMKLFGLYFHRERRHRRHTDDAKWNPAMTATATTSTRLRIYATVVLILIWANVVRLLSVFTRSDKFGALLLTKVSLLSWFGLIAMMYTAYYVASHTGTLFRVLTTVRVTQDCVRGVRRAALALTALCWISIVADTSFGAYVVFNTGQHDLWFAPFTTYFKVPKDKFTIVKVVFYMAYVSISPSVLHSHAMSLVLVYVFYNQYKKIEKHFSRALGEGQFYGDLSLFRRRQQYTVAIKGVTGCHWGARWHLAFIATVCVSSD